PDTGEPEMDMPGTTHETKILEKHNGEWLLVYVGYLHQSVHQIDHPLIEVDGTGRVLWSNAQSAREMANGSVLKIVAGRICTSNKSDTKRLRDVIGWAATLCDVVDSQSGAVPVVLSSEEDCEHHLCWVMANSGKIYVAINNEDLTEQRLSAAALIHGLTPAQTHLAREIVAGHDLPTAAKNLKVSSTTLRTQLQRIYDKVGIRTQPALVRILMSSAAPTIQM
ncbi:MAG: helix-turn-helix transcriptional regulator, partial [Pseudomonadota bacterium]